MSSPIDFESKLRDLSQRQCQILYWVCQGLTFKEVAAKIGYGEDLVTAEMSRIYRVFGLTQQRRNLKRKILEETICPLHLQRVSEPETDCRERVIEVNAPPPDPDEIREVREDVQNGLIPLKGALVRVEPRPEARREQRTGALAVRGEYPFLPPAPPPKENRWVWILVGILSTLLIIACLLIAGLVAIGPERIAGLFGSTATPALATLVVVLPTNTVPATLPPPTPQPTTPPLTPQPTTPPVQTAIATKEPTTPSPSATPPSISPTPCTPQTGTINLAGKVDSDIPGTPLCLETTVSSVIDFDTKKYDVYAVQLKAGDQVRFALNTSHTVIAILLNPDSKSMAENDISRAFSENAYSNPKWQRDFTPATSGTYYFVVQAVFSGESYTLKISRAGAAVPGEQIASDIPGTPLSIGSSNSSVIDYNTKSRDVYAVELTAGQPVRFSLVSSGTVIATLYNPDSKSIETNDTSRAWGENAYSKWQRDFTPAVTGTYYFAVAAVYSGETYTLSLKAQ